MVQGGSTTAALAGSLSWLALVVVGLIHAAGAEAPPAVEIVSALLATPVALAGGALAVAAIWRGPAIVAFSRADAVACSPSEAAFVRSHAQLRGMMGGAGHLYPQRLVLPAAAWLAGAAVGACGLTPQLEEALGVWPVAVAIAAALLAILFPARAYFYRDTTGGGAILSPPSSAFRLKRRARAAGALPLEGPAPTPAPTPTPGAEALPVRPPSSAEEA